MEHLQSKLKIGLIIGIWIISLVCAAQAEEAAPAKQGTMPFSSEADAHKRTEKRMFPLFMDKFNVEGSERQLPPPFGIMFITNWMDSDWKFDSAAVSVGGAPSISLDAAANATMDLKVWTNGVKLDLWVLPFLDLMVGFGKVDVDAQLGLRDIPLDFNVVSGTWTRGDAIVPMKFDGTYYSIGAVLAGAYKRFYAAMDMSAVKTDLSGNATLSESGFWTFTVAPKVGYNAGLSQVYIGARYISKNEHYTGTVPLASGQNMSFDVKINTSSWAGNFGMRTVIRDHWELFMESAMGNRFQITGGVGYRF